MKISANDVGRNKGSASAQRTQKNATGPRCVSVCCKNQSLSITHMLKSRLVAAVVSYNR